MTLLMLEQKNVQLVDKDPEKAILMFWVAINAGDRVDSALKDMAIVMKQQNYYIKAEEAYRCALSIAPGNNKMCNLGICLMKQGRIGEAKETLYQVKPTVMDGPRGSDSHLKAYERAQQMLKDLESEMMNKGVDRIEQSRLFEAFLGSSSIWQPQPCKTTTTMNSAGAANSPP